MCKTILVNIVSMGHKTYIYTKYVPILRVYNIHVSLISLSALSLFTYIFIISYITVVDILANASCWKKKYAKQLSIRELAVINVILTYNYLDIANTNKITPRHIDLQYDLKWKTIIIRYYLIDYKNNFPIRKYLIIYVERNRL